jgi:hypothetical protein
MSDQAVDPFPNPASPLPPPDDPALPIGEPEPDRLPDEAPDPNPDENDEPAKYSVEELRAIYGLSPQDAARKIRRFGSLVVDLDPILGARFRTPAHRPQDIDRAVDQVTFG